MNYPVVIAGAGPVGLMLACELRLAGVETLVIERLAEPSLTSPGMAINSATIELLDQRGLMSGLRDGTFELPSGHFSLLWLDASKLESYRPKSIVVPQRRVEQVLEKRAAELGMAVRRGHEITGVEADDFGVVITVRSAAGEDQLHCDYLVGCDGADSVVRRSAGIDFTGTESPFRGLVGDIRVDFTEVAGEHFGARICPPHGIYTGAPIEPGVLRITTAEFDEDSGPAPATMAEFQASIERLTGVPLKAGELIWVGRYPNVNRQAERYRSGRVFLAGDAAHVHFPLSGLALNTGIQDAVNLGWKLAAEINGWAPAGLLDSYHAERHPAGRRACACAKAQVALLHPISEVGALREVFTELLALEAVNRHLLDQVLGLDLRYELDGDHALIGARLPHVTLTGPDGKTDVAELLRAGRGVLLTMGEAAPGRRAAVAGWADRVDVASAEPVPEIGATALLLRADGHVIWAQDSADRDEDGEALRHALLTWFGEPR